MKYLYWITALCFIPAFLSLDDSPVSDKPEFQWPEEVSRLPSIEFKTDEMENASYKDYLIGKINYRKDSAFVKVDSQHTDKTTYLRKEVYQAFLEMRQAAMNDGLELIIVSGARNFEYQKWIWNLKWKDHIADDSEDRALDILKYSSMPGSSRHHWGTDIDLNELENSYFESGEGKEIYTWLKENGGKYGFCQVYTDKKEGRTGYEMEHWHWSYMPIAHKLLKDYNELISYKDIKGFKGSETARNIGLIENYVNGVDCHDFPQHTDTAYNYKKKKTD